MDLLLAESVTLGELLTCLLPPELGNKNNSISRGSWGRSGMRHAPGQCPISVHGSQGATHGSFLGTCLPSGQLQA